MILNGKQRCKGEKGRVCVYMCRCEYECAHEHKIVEVAVVVGAKASRAGKMRAR
jgi:hypothetical protein